MNKSSESYKVYLEKSEAAPSGVHSTQPEGPQGSQGRRPQPMKVEDAKEVPGAAVKAGKVQTGENRYPINSYVQQKKEHGPNN
jgi:uncharacterized protein with von Willebrand factor type A (vWA) domain